MIANQSMAIQGTAYLEASAFVKYEYHEEQEIVEIAIPLQEFTQILQLLSPEREHHNRSEERTRTESANGSRMPTQHVPKSGGKFRILLETLSSPLLITLEERGIITNCKLYLFDSSHQTASDLIIPLHVDQLQFKLIMPSKLLYTALSELDSDAEFLSIDVRASPPRFRLQGKGTYGTFCIDYPYDKNIIESFLCKDHFTFNYRFNLIRRCFTALSLADKVSIKADESGTLGIQVMLDGGSGRHSFSEFRIVANIADD